MYNLKMNPFLRYGLPLIGIAVAVVLFTRVLPGMTQATVVLVLLTVVICSALFLGGGPGLVASIAGAMCYNYAFIPPIGTFAIASPEDIVAFAVFSVTALIVSGLSSTVARRVGELEQQKKEVEELHAFATALIETPDTPQGAAAIADRIVGIFHLDYCGIHIPDRTGAWQHVSLSTGYPRDMPLPHPDELHRRTLEGFVAEHELGVRYRMLETPQGTVGMLALRSAGIADHTMTAIASMVALTLQRNRSVHPVRQ